MIELTQNLANQLTGTNRLIGLSAIRRGWKIKMPHISSPHMYADRGDGVELHLFSSTPPSTSYADAHFVDDKYSTYLMLLEHDIEQLETELVNNTQGTAAAETLMNKHGVVVVKPIDGGHGKGITVNVRTLEQLADATDIARQNNKSIKGALVQQQFTAEKIHDIRVVCIAGTFIAAIERVPARVFGDGTHTIEQLIELENKKPERGEPYRNKLAIIDLVAVKRFLKEDIHKVPEAGQEVAVLGVANYGAGGELIDLTDDIPEWMKQEAEKASNVLCLDVSGVDYMTNIQVRADMTRADVEAVIVEVNKCPALAIHDEPTYGKPRHVTEAYLDFIASL